MISTLSAAIVLPYLRASLLAPSLASAPLLQMKARSRPVSSTSVLANLVCSTV